jgi:hypothetical protein
MQILTPLTDAEWHKARDELLVEGCHEHEATAGA